ncbi:MAG: PEP/pyruvate-binding domain-containing protein, partial [Ignavibacteriales bacterium]
MTGYVRWFEEIGLSDLALVGGKNASLGELYSTLKSANVRVPNGFAVTAEAYRDALTQAGAWDELHRLLDTLDVTDVAALSAAAKRARQVVYDATGGPELRDEIIGAYRRLQQEYGEDASLAVRSSATAEDLPTASFAGQHESYLHVSGDDELVDACRRCFASIFTDRAIVYRVQNGFDHFKVFLSVGVMKMVRS